MPGDDALTRAAHALGLRVVRTSDLDVSYVLGDDILVVRVGCEPDVAALLAAAVADVEGSYVDG